MKRVLKKDICPLIEKKTEYLRRGEYRTARIYTERILDLIDYSYEWYAD